MKNVLKNKIFWIVLGITLVGAFLRAYHFEDWMHYQLDQARDFRVVHAAMEYGPGELPLQGPRAAGSFLRLGPLLYYLEYGSAVVFGDTPAGSVTIILILNVLAIPLFYVFLRRFFDGMLSAGLTGIFAVSLFMIVYSRFGWNPTLIPFFMILFVYALLKTNDRINKNAGWWLVIASIALAFIANMHFIALVTVPVIAALYFIWVRPWISLRWWFLAFIVFAFLNVPLIVNDVKTGGENIVEFIDVALNRGGGDEDDAHNIVDKVVRNVGAHTQYYWLILTGDQFAGLPELKGSDIQCNYDCRKGLVRGVISFIMVFFGVVGWVWLYRIENDSNKKDFLKLTAIWAIIVFVVYVPLAYDIAPRFFLLNAPLMFVLLGFVPKAISSENKKPGKIVAVVLIVLCIVSNLFFVIKYYGELSAVNDEAFVLDYRDRILKEKTRVTLEQIEEIADWMEEKYNENGYPIFIHAQAEYKRAFWERIDVRNIPRDHIPKDLNPIYREGNYFVVIRTQSDQKEFLEKFVKGMDIIDTKNFGTMNAYQLQQKAEVITDEKKNFEPSQRDPRFSKDVQPRYLWRQVFEGCTYNTKTDKCEQ